MQVPTRTYPVYYLGKTLEIQQIGKQKD